jgi:hypothetical protein
MSRENNDNERSQPEELVDKHVDVAVEAVSSGFGVFSTPESEENSSAKHEENSEDKPAT